MELFNAYHLVYWSGLALIILLEAATFGILWERKEAHRWTMGYFTVFYLGIPLLILGVWDVKTWIGLFFAVGVSGAVKVGFEAARKSWQARQLRKGDASKNGTSPWRG